MTSPSQPSGIVAGSVLPIRRAEELIATLPGVLSVRIVPSETGAVDEIHVLTTDLVPPKNTVRNIESALMAQLGLRVNHRKISIATTLDAPRATDGPAAPAPGAPAAASAPVASAPAASAPQAVGTASPLSATGGHVTSAVASPSVPLRAVGTNQSSLSAGLPDTTGSRRLLVFEDVEVRRSRSRGVLVRVTLTRDGQEYFGEAEGQETERSRIELAARATLQAIIAAMKATPGGERSLALEGSKLIEAFDREFIFVSVAARVSREPVALTGSCEVRESAETSAVLAVLDATNRWVHLDR